MARVSGVAPRGKCRPADRRVAPPATRSRSRTVTAAPGSVARISRAIMHPITPAPITAIPVLVPVLVPAPVLVPVPRAVLTGRSPAADRAWWTTR